MTIAVHNLRSPRRSRAGTIIAEHSAALVVFIPILVLLAFVAMEAYKGICIKLALEQAARESAHLLADAYANNPDLPNNPAKQKAFGFDPIRISGIVVSSAQFSTPVWTNVAGAPNNPAVINDPALPQTVAVTVTFTSGQNGLSQFPDYDPLNLGSKFVLTGTSSYGIQ